MKYFIVFIMMLPLYSCAAQESKIDTNLNKNKMEKFDKMLFDKKKINGHYDFSLKDGSMVSQFEVPLKYYVERISNPASPFETYKEFYYNSCSLKNSGGLFYSFPVGIWTEYDESGKIVNETNEDAPYKFSITDLDAKLKKMNINIMVKPSDITVTRNDSPYPYYKVNHPVSKDGRSVEVLVISGVNGEIISKQAAEVYMK